MCQRLQGFLVPSPVTSLGFPPEGLPRVWVPQPSPLHSTVIRHGSEHGREEALCYRVIRSQCLSLCPWAATLMGICIHNCPLTSLCCIKAPRRHCYWGRVGGRALHHEHVYHFSKELTRDLYVFLKNQTLANNSNKVSRTIIEKVNERNSSIRGTRSHQIKRSERCSQKFTFSEIQRKIICILTLNSTKGAYACKYACIF